MKTIQRGFIVPLLLVVIALLLLGGGAYVFTQKKSANPPVTGSLPVATSTAQTSVSQTVSGTSVTLTTTDICSPLLNDETTLLFIDTNNKTWKVDYQNASFSEYSYTTGKVQGTDGLLKTTLQDWLKSLYRVGQPQALNCGAPGKITITGALVGDIVFASHIELSGQ